MNVKETIGKAEGFFAKLPFRAMAEKIPAAVRAKFPLLDKAIPFANQIACGLIAVIVIATIAASGAKDGGGAGGGGATSATGTSSGKSSDGGDKYYIYHGNDLLRVRSEPDTSADNIVHRLADSDKVVLLETGKMDSMDGINAPWFKVKTMDGKTGWVFSGYLTAITDTLLIEEAQAAEKAAAEAQREMEKVSTAGKIAGANFGAFPADYPVSNMGGFTVRELYGPDTRFAMRINERPCRIVIASSSGTASEFTAALLLKVRNSQDKEVDAIRLEARFHADNVREVSSIRYCKYEDLGSGQSVEREYYPGGDVYDQGEVIGAFIGAAKTFWNKDWDPKKAALPEELWGTWFREGAASGREYDTTWIITAGRMQIKFSDGRTRILIINQVKAWENNPNDSSNKAANKAAEYPAGWRYWYTVLEHEDTAEVGKDYSPCFILNASKNA
jgi:hypothetical protein